MKPKKDLHELIRSLDKFELGYVRKYFNRLSDREDVTYIRLFEAIRKQTEYDEPALKTLFPEIPTANSFAVAKHYLADKILEALDKFHFNNSEFAPVFAQLRKLELLFQKGLYDQCHKLIRKMEKQGDQGNEALNLIKLEWQKRLTKVAFGNKVFEKQLEKIRVEEKDLVRDIERNQQAWENNLNVFWIYTKGYSAEEIVKPIQQAVDHMADLDQTGKATIQSTILDLEAKILIHHSLTELTKMQEVAEELVSFLEQYPDRFRWETFRYYSALSLLISACINVRDFNMAARHVLRGIQMMKKAGSVMPHLRGTIFRALFNSEVRIYCGLGLYQTGIDRLSQLQKPYIKYVDKLPFHTRLNMLPNTAWLYFGKGDFSKTRFWLNRSLPETAPGSYIQAYIKAKIIELATQFEMGEFDLLEASSESFRKFLERRNAASHFLLEYLRLMRKLCYATVPAENKQIFAEFLQKFNSLKETAPKSLNGSSLFDIELWAQSKVGHASLQELVREKFPVTAPEVFEELRSERIRLD